MDSRGFSVTNSVTTKRGLFLLAGNVGDCWWLKLIGDDWWLIDDRCWRLLFVFLVYSESWIFLVDFWCLLIFVYLHIIYIYIYICVCMYDVCWCLLMFVDVLMVSWCVPCFKSSQCRPKAAASAEHSEEVRRPPSPNRLGGWECCGNVVDIPRFSHVYSLYRSMVHYP